MKTRRPEKYIKNVSFRNSVRVVVTEFEKENEREKIRKEEKEIWKKNRKTEKEIRWNIGGEEEEREKSKGKGNKNYKDSFM